MQNKSTIVNSDGDVPNEGKKLDMFKSFVEPPEWLNRSFIEAALQDYKKDPKMTVIITSF